MSTPRLLAGLLALHLGACEVSTPPAGTTPSTAPDGRSPQAATEPSAGRDPARAVEPLPPAEPPWSTAAGLAYREVVLGSTDPDAPLPMIVAIHGLGDTPDNFRGLLLDFPEPVRVILPRGLDAAEGGWSWFPIRARDPDVHALSQGIATAADRIATGIDELRRTRATVGKPIVTGFSQGGMLAFTLAVAHPESFGHAVAIGGWLPPPLVPEAKSPGVEFPPIDALNGTADKAVFYEPTQQVVQTLAERGFAATLHTYEGVGHMITPDMRRDLFDQLSDAIDRERRREPSP